MGGASAADEVDPSSSAAYTGPAGIEAGGTGTGAAGSNEFTSSLGRLGLGAVEQEPLRLKETLADIDSELNALSVSNYDVHLGNARCLAAVQIGAMECRENCKIVEDNLDPLASELKRFKSFGERAFEALARNSRTLGKHVQLLELLEIPQLMDTCVRNELYDEALDLCAFTSTLQKRHLAIANGVGKTVQRRASEEVENKQQEEEQRKESESNLALAPTFQGGTTIVNSIAEEVYASARHLRRQLLQHLMKKVNLPDCLRYVSYLRRLDAQERVRKSLATNSASSNLSGSSGVEERPEVHLRFEFLDCRDAYIRSLASEPIAGIRMGENRPYQQSIKLIDRCRINWFDVITQYKAIFATGDNVLAELDEDGGILSRWVSGKMIDFLETLNKAVAGIDDFGALANVFEQALKFGISLARVGADFRPLLVHPFTQRVHEVMHDMWQQAVERTEQVIRGGEKQWGSPLPIPRAKPSPSALSSSLVEQSDQHDDFDDTEAGILKSEGLEPPNEILEFPVAAEFTNMVLSSFNELRQCASPLFAVGLGRDLQSNLERLQVALHDAGAAGQENNSEKYGRLCTVFADVVLPYLQKCFDALFDCRSFSQVRTFLDVKPLQTQIQALKSQFASAQAVQPPAPPVPQLGKNSLSPPSVGNENGAQNLESNHHGFNTDEDLHESTNGADESKSAADADQIVGDNGESVDKNQDGNDDDDDDDDDAIDNGSGEGWGADNDSDIDL